MEQSLQLINSFLDRLFIHGAFWIYLALFLALFIENIFPPFPGDFFTIAGGALAAAGRLNIYLVFLTVYAGGIASVMLVYYLGLNYGRSYFLRKNFRFFSAEDILRLEKWFKKRGSILLILNRFIVGGRSIIALVAGISGYNTLRAYLFLSISFAAFNGFLLFGGYIFVVNFETIAAHFKLYEKIVWPIVILIGAILIYAQVRKSSRDEK
jgi:membrane protein DedA with SNARE-associated domain